MFPRLAFWSGLLLGGLAGFHARRRPLPAPLPERPDPLLSLVRDAVVVCDGSGRITSVNPAARDLFGPEGQGMKTLRYPSGQPVPPGQLPISLTQRTGIAVEGELYQHVTSVGRTRALEVFARPMPESGAVALFRDVTAQQAGQAREADARRREGILAELCRRLALAPDADELARSVVESALALTDGLPGARARLYLLDPERKRLTRLASAPEDRPKRPRSHRQAQAAAFPFDANAPLLWQTYIARQVVVCSDVAADDRFLLAPLAEEQTGSACALPLLAGGITLGHLSVTCPAAGAWEEETERVDALSRIAAVAALSLLGARQAAQAAQLAGQGEALRDMAQAVADRQDIGALADLMAGHAGRVLGSELCTLALFDPAAGRLRLAGEAYRDALLFPERHPPGDPALIEDVACEAVRAGKMVMRLGLPNPRQEAGHWRVFAGQSGRHSLLSAPLRAGRGALTVYWSGETALASEEVQFIETLAALLSLATLPEARTGS